jgi:hypothetical protein
VTNACNVAVDVVLVAPRRSRPDLVVYSARVPVTLSVTTSVTGAVCVIVPLLPVIVSGKEPGVVAVVVVTVNVDDPEEIAAGENVLDAPVGKPVADSATLPVNPPVGVTVTE